MDIPKGFEERQRAKGLYPCPDCKCCGVDDAKMLVAMKTANETGEIPPMESAFCETCNGIGWLRPRIVRIVDGK